MLGNICIVKVTLLELTVYLERWDTLRLYKCVNLWFVLLRFIDLVFWNF